MKKIINIVLLSSLPLISFAQRADRFGEIKEQSTAGPADGAPIDQYEIALIIMAVSIIAYFVYRQYTAKKQA